MTGKVVVLTGGVGGAKLALGLTQIVPPEDITAIVNTGDDFRHLGLHVSPDIDTLLYTLSGKANAAQGWGRAGETWSFMQAVRTLGGEDWFSLGDGDLALHALRTERLARGEALSAITADFAQHWGIGVRMLPMSDNPVATELETDEGLLEFQHYFVRRRCEPVVRSIRFRGVDDAAPAPGVLESIRRATAILIAPSNPYLSVDPILAIPGIKSALAEAAAPVVAVSPLIAGKAVKGPTAKLMAELGVASDAASIARHYADVLDGLLVDERDVDVRVPCRSARADTLMQTLTDRARVARAAVDFAETLRTSAP